MKGVFIMVELLDLGTIGARLRKIDKQIIALLSQRMKLSLQVEQWKEQHAQPILRPETENERLEGIAEFAKTVGVNPHFARAMLYFIIRESCAVQIDYLQDKSQHEVVPSDEAEWYQQLKGNLLALTAEIADRYDQFYDQDFFATHAYLGFEDKLLKREMFLLEDKGLALDIGCATGRISIDLAPVFNQVIGYDISPDMITQAKAKLTKEGLQHVRFEVVDVENGIPLESAAVSLVVMNMGTASDIQNIQGLLKETERVLKPDGRFLLSFYNKEALFYRWFIPWPINLAAEINLQKHCLDVHCGEKIYSIYARPYATDEVRALMPEGLSISSILTYPTISSILPNELFEDTAVQKSITEIDEKLSDLSSGAYILVTGVKE